ncbi:MAG TPA: alcohol dehydrogenase catalytic domain-containing protein [Chitinophagaceae bacterium]|nr:alcohol dehydrogenase catalytic domain-containing protein [Chitinophagaceae bacterium]
MKAAVFHKPGDIGVDSLADPVIEKPDDIILKVTSTAICGSDLHIYNGFVPQLRDEVLGHEFMSINQMFPVRNLFLRDCLLRHCVVEKFSLTFLQFHQLLSVCSLIFRQ